MIDKYFYLFLPLYTFAPLSSYAAFTGAVINMYGKKNPEDAGQKALDSCIQGDSSISDYNARFLAVCYSVPLTEHSCVAAYVKGLNANIMGIVDLNPTWPLAQCLEDHINITTAAGFSLEQNSLLLANHPLNFSQQQQHPSHNN
ncbi:hypothetical protein CROQUDRAFT_209085 [Cronartium quercuum f. sp. fusiforme G11]|uniref:Retrotransposon gag domain-containing protein n=1 Tax=Cronartium quercuum f. sp. fusiforme G11 TaxID=708437 RepID=A0A9P6NB54_9BASI|nr:hypothetical protein CROQUDRAFT_209085 [Cronartium quercuum f. sp. fusiforme G11]